METSIKRTTTATTTTTISFLMPLSQLAGVKNFCFNLISPFLSIVRILSSQAISSQLLLYALFPQVSWSIRLLFPSYFKLHNLYTNADGFALSSTPYYNNTHYVPNNIIRHPIDQSHITHYPDHMTLHSTQPHVIRNSKFPRFTTVQQRWSNTTPINLSPLIQR